MNAHLNRRDIFSYSLLAMPLAFAGMPLYVHAPDYYATHYGISLSLIGIVLLGLRFIDAIQDPLIGYVSDRFSSRRITFMSIASLILVCSFAALFQPPTALTLVWFACTLFLATSAFSVLSINLNMLGGVWSTDTYQKTRITTMREACGLIGLLLAVIMPSILMQFMPAQNAFLYVGLMLCGLMIIAWLFFNYWRKKHALMHTETLTTPSHNILSNLSYTPKPTRRFFAVYALSMLASSIPALLVLFFIRDRLGEEEYTGIFLMLYFIAGAAGMPLWQYLSNCYSKYTAWKMAMLLATIIFIWAFTLDKGDTLQFALICVFSGIAFGADLTLPPSILADHIDHHQLHATAATQFSVIAFLSKAALAIASAITLPLLDMYGFSPGTENTTQALWALSVSYALIPCIIKIAAIIMLHYWFRSHHDWREHE